ncbi:MAG: hypothetical protein ABIQ31_13580 [Ferruginibacter sp.]
MSLVEHIVSYLANKRMSYKQILNTMTNNKPFQILLDYHDQDCFQLFCVLKSLCDYPSIHDDSGYDDYDGKLYAAAFSFICSDYLVEFAKMYPHEDFEGFVDEMNFKDQIDDPIELAQNYGVEYIEDFEDLIYNIIKQLRVKICDDIKLLFPTELLQLRFFGSIFNMDETNGYMPSSYDYPTTQFLH